MEGVYSVRENLGNRNLKSLFCSSFRHYSEREDGVRHDLPSSYLGSQVEAWFFYTKHICICIGIWGINGGFYWVHYDI